MFIGEPGGSRVSNTSRGVWHYCSNKSRGVLLEEIRYRRNSDGVICTGR